MGPTCALPIRYRWTHGSGVENVCGGSRAYLRMHGGEACASKPMAHDSVTPSILFVVNVTTPQMMLGERATRLLPQPVRSEWCSHRPWDLQVRRRPAKLFKSIERDDAEFWQATGRTTSFGSIRTSSASCLTAPLSLRVLGQLPMSERLTVCYCDAECSAVMV